MSDNPFLEPRHDDRTIIRPQPGGRRQATAGGSAMVMPVAEPFPPVAGSANALLVAATPLLQLLARLRNSPAPPFSGDLRDSVAGALRGFEQRARAAGVAGEQLQAAHRALCVSLDDVVLNTPWGRAGGWAAPLATAGEADWFFDQLARMQRHPAGWLAVLELMYLCLSLGFMGRCRQSADGAAELERIRAATHAAIMQQRKPAESGLSPHWAGVAAPYRPGSGAGLPVWVAASFALAGLTGLFVWCSAGLGAASDAATARMLAAAPAAMPAILRAGLVPPPAPGPAGPSLAGRLRAVLQDDIGQHLIAVTGSASATVLRLGTDGLFAPGSATIEPAALPLLQRVGTALAGAPAGLRVICYTDNQPVRTLRFPSGFELSSARALAVREVLGRATDNAQYLVAEGRADADPVASNATPEGRAQNRRIEIVLQTQP
jgi:type VI secretion system protein ImpK